MSVVDAAGWVLVHGGCLEGGAGTVDICHNALFSEPGALAALLRVPPAG